MEVKIRDLTVHYEEVGAGRPFVFIHGWPGNEQTALPLIENYLVGHSGWRRIYPNLLDFGDSGLPDWLQSPDDLVEVLVEFMQALAPGERFVVGGGSWGGYPARALVQRCLKQVDGVLLALPVIALNEDERDLPPKQIIHTDPDFAAALQPGEEWLLDFFVGQSLSTLQDMRDNVMAHLTPVDPQVASRLARPFSFDPDALPEPCPAPTLIVAGRQDLAVGYKQTWSLIENFPRATLAVLDRAGHALIFEQPALWRALLNEWLDRVEEYAVQNANP